MESILASLLQARKAQLIEATRPLKTFELEGLPDTESRKSKSLPF